MRARSVLIAVSFATLVGFAASYPSCASAEPVTTCGQEVTGVGVLTGDLDCTGMTKPGVTVRHGSLAMGGFTIKGGNIGINCTGPCAITGPGTVRDATIGINAYGTLKLSGVNATNNEYIGVQCFKSCSVTGPASLSDNGGVGEPYGHGITSAGILKLDGVTISNNLANGIEVGTYPKPHGKVKARNTVVTGNRNGIVADKSVELVSSTVTGNTAFGVSVGEIGCAGAGKLKLKSSTVTGNGTDGDCGTTIACADLAACRAPVVVGSSCDRSYVNDSGIPGTDWGVCAGD